MMHDTMPEPADDEVTIVDLDPIEQKGRSFSKKILAGKYFGPWVRWCLALLVLTGGGTLFYLIWPDAASVLGKLKGQSSASSPASAPLVNTNQNMNFNLLSANGIIYVSSLNYTVSATPHGTLDALREKDGVHLWRYSGTIIAPTQFSGGILYIPSSTGLDALRASDRTLLWHNPVIALSWQLARGVLYIHSLADGLLALHADSGKFLWQRKDITDNAPSLSNDIIYTHSQEATPVLLIALRISDGTTLWSYHLPPSLGALFRIQGQNGAVSVIGSGSQNSILVLRSSDGTLIWQKTSQIIDSPGNDLLYTVSNLDNSLNVQRVTDGTLLWRHPFPQGASFLIDHDVVYFLIPAKNVGALRASDGTLLWQHDAATGNIQFVQDGVLCILKTDNNGATALIGLRTSDGSQLWQHPIPGSLSGRALPSGQQNHIIYFFAVSTDVSGFIEALQNNTGSLLWHYITNEQNRSASIGLTQDGITYMAISNTGTILALRSSQGSLFWSYESQKK